MFQSNWNYKENTHAHNMHTLFHGLVWFQHFFNGIEQQTGHSQRISISIVFFNAHQLTFQKLVKNQIKLSNQFFQMHSYIRTHERTHTQTHFATHQFYEPAVNFSFEMSVWPAITIRASTRNGYVCCNLKPLTCSGLFVHTQKNIHSHTWQFIPLTPD